MSFVLVRIYTTYIDSFCVSRTNAHTRDAPLATLTKSCWINLRNIDVFLSRPPRSRTSILDLMGSSA